jgi:hypothetical protein
MFVGSEKKLRGKENDTGKKDGAQRKPLVRLF